MAGYDVDESCKHAYEANTGAQFRCADVASISANEVEVHFRQGATRLLSGCAPCQPYSALRQAADPSKDAKGSLLDHFRRLAREIRPDYVTMENVPQLRTYPIFKTFVTSLRRAGYGVSYDVVFCPDYGIPQERRRLVLLAALDGELALPAPTHSHQEYVNVADALAHLPPLEAGATDAHDPLHRCASLTALNLKRIRHSLPGGTWRDWPRELILKCHKAASGRSYSGVYGRMRWDAPSPTVTTQFYNLGSGRFGHPEQDRALSLREAAILQSFPEDYDFGLDVKRVPLTTLATLIGNAVPPKLGEAVGKAIVDHAGDRTDAGTRQRRIPSLA